MELPEAYFFENISIKWVCFVYGALKSFKFYIFEKY